MASTITTGTITATDTISVTATAPSFLITGSPSANSFLTVTAPDEASVMVLVTGTFAGTLVFEKAVDNATSWVPIGLTNISTGVYTSRTSVAGAWSDELHANGGFRVRAISLASGTASITITIGGGGGGSSALVPATTGGLSVFKTLWPGNTTPQAVFGSGSTAGQLYGHFLSNNAASTRFIRLFDKATAPVMGTDSPKLVYALPAGAAANVEASLGKAFTLGMWVSVTTGLVDLDNSAPSANDVELNLYYFAGTGSGGSGGTGSFSLDFSAATNSFYAGAI